MVELLLSTLKIAVSPAIKLGGYVLGRFRRPSVEFHRAPKNLLEHVHPGVSVAKMREVLGVPRHEEQGQFRYVFSEACVQIDSADSKTIDAVSIALSGVKTRNRFPVWPLNRIVLGETTLIALLAADDEPKFSSSSKHSHTYVEQYYGFPGMYFTYAFGVLECPRVWGDKYFWQPGQPRSELPEKMKINWVCVSGSSALPEFMYLGFM